MNKLLFYDIECFKFDSLVVFKDIDNQVVWYSWNKFDGLFSLITNHVLIGYNNYHYDDYMLTMMMKGVSQEELKQLNDELIGGMDVGFKVSEFIHSLDCFQELSMKPSLKKIEGNMGKSIKESSVPFDIDRPLTESEKHEVFQYCSYDVENTIEVFKLREHEYFESKLALSNLLDKLRSFRWNTTTISTNILLDKPMECVNELMFPVGVWKQNKDIPQSVWNMWDSCKNIRYDVDDSTSIKKTESSKVSTIMYDCKFDFGFGGLHGVNLKGNKFMNVKLLDVSSMYPSIIINLNILGNATPKYNDIRIKRLELKHTDKVLSNAYKLILNSVYGNLKNKYSNLFNPMLSNTVCIYGQIILFDLCGRLYRAGYKLVNINTDGIAFVDDHNIGDDYIEIWKQWEHEYNLILELDEFDAWIQKDVNNYIATKDDVIKTKGGDVNKAFHNQYFKNNDARIVQIALVEYLVNGTSVIDTLLNHLNEPLLYQYVLNTSNKFKGTYDSTGCKMNKINRVFAVKKQYAGNKLYKKRLDGGIVNFNNIPNNMMIWNDDVSNLKNFEEIIDLNHYYNIIQNILGRWRQ